MFELVSYTVNLEKPGRPVSCTVRSRVPFGNRTLEQPVQLSFETADLLALATDSGTFGEREICLAIKAKIGADVTPATPQPQPAP